MPTHSRSKNGVASLAYAAGIYVLLPMRSRNKKDVDGRDKFALGPAGGQTGCPAMTDHNPT